MKKILVLAIAVLAISFAFAAMKEDINIYVEYENSTSQFDVTLHNNGAPIDEFRVYAKGLDNFECLEPDGWTVIQMDNFPESDLGKAGLCWYFTSDSLRGIETFSFKATSEDQSSPVEMKFELREDAEKNGEITAFYKEFEWGVE